MTRKARSRQKKLGRSTSRRTTLVGSALVLCAALVAIGPLLLSGPSCGADVHFHLVSWLDAQRSMLQGVIYPSWANSPNFGAGEPRFVFYPPLSWMAGALMGLVLPWNTVLHAVDFLLLAATGLATRALAREALEDGPATLAGCASIFLGYSLYSIYQRCNYAELTGGFWIPLLLLFALRNRNPGGRLRERVLDGSAAPLALVMAGIWLSNGPLGIISTYLLAAIACASAALQKSWAPIARAAVGAGIGVTLTAIYLVPAFWERNWANIRDAVTQRDYLIRNNWLFHLESDSISPSHAASLQFLSEVSIFMFLVAFGGSLVARLWHALPGERRWWVPLALIPAVVLFLQFPISLGLWNWMPGLKFLQFPSRLLLVMQSTAAIFFASVVWAVPLRRRIVILAACGMVSVVLSTATWGICFKDCRMVEEALPGLVAQGAVRGKPEYSPQGIQSRTVEPNLHANCLVTDLAEVSDGADLGSKPGQAASQGDCRGSFGEVANWPKRKEFTGIAEQAGYLILRLRSYPAWTARVNGVSVPALMERSNGLMAVPVSKGPVTVIVDWTTTNDVIAGRWLSAFAVLLLAGLALVERKLAPSRVS